MNWLRKERVAAGREACWLHVKKKYPQEDKGDGGGNFGDPGVTNPVCVGVCDTTRTVVKSLSSASNRASVSASNVARFMSHLASHSESTVT